MHKVERPPESMTVDFEFNADLEGGRLVHQSPLKFTG